MSLIRNQETILESQKIMRFNNPQLKTNPHRMLTTALIQSLKDAWAERNDFFVGGNMFVYFNPNQKFTQDYCELDFFVALNTMKNEERGAWVVWEENESKPNIIIELSSNIDINQKKTIYEQSLKTEDYFVFDPYDLCSLRGWHLVNQRYQELQPNDKGWLWSSSLGLWLGLWEGTLEHASRIWLRFYNQEGQLLLLPEEKVADARQKAAVDRQHNELAVRLAEKAAQKMEEAIQQAAVERHQKESALQQAEKAQQRAKKLTELLQKHVNA